MSFFTHYNLNLTEINELGFSIILIFLRFVYCIIILLSIELICINWSIRFGMSFSKYFLRCYDINKNWYF